MRNFIRAAFLLGLSLGGCGLMTPAFAQAQGASVQAAPTRLDAATFLQGQANGASSCNAVSQTAVQDTVTITPPGSQSVYITGLYIDESTDATGSTAVPTLSSTNIAGAPFWSVATTLSTVSGVGSHYAELYPQPLKSAVPGTAVTIVPSATLSAHTILCLRVAGYFAP